MLFVPMSLKCTKPSYSEMLTGAMAPFHSPLSVFHENLDFGGPALCWICHEGYAVVQYMTTGVL